MKSGERSKWPRRYSWRRFFFLIGLLFGRQAWHRGSPVCPPGPGSFVLVCLAGAQSPDPPDEKSPKKSCFFRPAPTTSPRKTQARYYSHSHRLRTRAPASEGADGRGGKKAESLWESSLPPPSFAHFHTSTDIPLPVLPGPEGIVLLDFAPV